VPIPGVITSRTTSALVLGAAILGGLVRPAWAQAPAAGIKDVSLSIHYRARADRALADVMADLLGAFDYRVTAKRLAAEPGGGEVRYFRTVDRKAAFHVQSIVENVLPTKGPPRTLAVVHRSGRRVPPGRIEIWVSSRAPNKAGSHRALRVQPRRGRSASARGAVRTSNSVRRDGASDRTKRQPQRPRRSGDPERMA
jgi:hypothetical protein